MTALRRAILATMTALLFTTPAFTMSHVHASTAAMAAVTVASARVLVTPNGHTLYVFAADPPSKSTCYRTCAKYWPPVLVAKGIRLATTIAGVPGTFGVTVRKDGQQQLTYDHAPLYTFLLDKKPGDMNGQGLFAVGGYWWIVVAGGK